MLPGKRTRGPEAASRELGTVIRRAKEALREVDADLVAFRDIAQLKASLRHYRVGPSADDELEFMQNMAPTPRRRRRR